MAHFAKIGLNSKVIEVVTVADDLIKDSTGTETESMGITHLEIQTGWALWVQTSYNTIENTHTLGGTPFRKNYAGVGYTWDEDRNAFIPPQPQNDGSWVLNETKCSWERPVALPEDADGLNYSWNEDNYQADNSTGWVSQSSNNVKA